MPTGEHTPHRRPWRLGDGGGGEVHQPLMFHQGLKGAGTGGEDVEGGVGDVPLGLRREGGGEGAEQRREEEYSQTAHVCSMRQDFVLSKWAVWGWLSTDAGSPAEEFKLHQLLPEQVRPERATCCTHR